MVSYRRHSILGMVNTNDNLTQAEVQRSLLKLNGSSWWERIWDVSDYMRKCPSCHAPINNCPYCSKELPSSALPPKRMGDFHGVHKGCYYLIECKSSQAKDGFLASYIKDHQHESLLKNARAGGRSLLMIANRFDMPLLYVLSYGQYCNATRGSKFVTWDRLAGEGVVLQRLPCEGEPYYNLLNSEWFR